MGGVRLRGGLPPHSRGGRPRCGGGRRPEQIYALWSLAVLLLFSSGMAVVGLGLLIALLRFRLWEADAVITRSAAYAVVTSDRRHGRAASSDLVKLVIIEVMGRRARRARPPSARSSPRASFRPPNRLSSAGPAGASAAPSTRSAMRPTAQELGADRGARGNRHPRSGDHRPGRPSQRVGHRARHGDGAGDDRHARSGLGRRSAPRRAPGARPTTTCRSAPCSSAADPTAIATISRNWKRSARSSPHWPKPCASRAAATRATTACNAPRRNGRQAGPTRTRLAEAGVIRGGRGGRVRFRPMADTRTMHIWEPPSLSATLSPTR